jgi:hypothetical protein
MVWGEQEDEDGAFMIEADGEDTAFFVEAEDEDADWVDAEEAPQEEA